MKKELEKTIKLEEVKDAIVMAKLEIKKWERFLKLAQKRLAGLKK